MSVKPDVKMFFREINVLIQWRGLHEIVVSCVGVGPNVVVLLIDHKVENYVSKIHT